MPQVGGAGQVGAREAAGHLQGLRGRQHLPEITVRGASQDCGGASICQHNRERSNYKDSGGAGICEHNRRRNTCRVYGGASICWHDRQRSRCKDCGGASICEHNRERRLSVPRLRRRRHVRTAKACAHRPTAGSGVIAKTARSAAVTRDAAGAGWCPMAYTIIRACFHPWNARMIAVIVLPHNVTSDLQAKTVQ